MARYSTADWSAGTFDLANATRTVLRAGVGLLFLQHGLQKVFGMLGGQAVPLDSLMGLAGLLELTGGVLMTLGLFTRPVAAVLAVEMLAAYVMAHQPRGGFPTENDGEIPLLFALVFVYFAGNGAGPVSIDAALGRRGRAAGGLDRDVRRAA